MSKEKTEKLNTILSLIKMDELLTTNYLDINERSMQFVKPNCGFYWVKHQDRIYLYFNKSWQNNSNWLAGFRQKIVNDFFNKELPLVQEYMNFYYVNHGFTLKVFCNANIPHENLDETLNLLLLLESKNQGPPAREQASINLHRFNHPVFFSVAIPFNEEASQASICKNI